MSTTAMMVLFGLVVPFVNIITGVLLGNKDEAVRKARDSYMNNHPVAIIIGTIIAYIPAIVYWIYVFLHM